MCQLRRYYTRGQRPHHIGYGGWVGEKKSQEVEERSFVTLDVGLA
jgi:hypothetical protein